MGMLKGHQTVLWVLLASAAGAASIGCGLDPDVAPVTDGPWFRPGVADTWQWQLRGTVNESYAVTVYDIDLFDSSAELVARLKASGRRVFCYFSAGSAENWREDYNRFRPTDMGLPLTGWRGERWLNIRSANVLSIMRKRLDKAVNKGCDGVEPDNMDGYANFTGFPLRASDQLAYNRALANDAHSRGLTVALKNDGGQAQDLVDYFDLALNEQCHEHNECGETEVFVSHSKPVFNAEYADRYRQDPERTSLCQTARNQQIRTLVLPLELDDSFRFSCDN